MKVILVHDWLTGYRGGERVLDLIARPYPQAPIFTLVHRLGSTSPSLEGHPVCTPALNRFSLYRRHYQYFLPVMPGLIRTFQAPQADLVLSTSHCVAKAFPVPRGALHISYIHTPMRYIYDQFDHYFGKGRSSTPVRLVMRTLRPWLALWDRHSNGGVTQFVANSHHVARRIRRYWGLDAPVIHPPVDLAQFQPPGVEKPGAYFLVVSALVAYKRIDIAIRAASRMRLPLVVVGGGR